MAGYCRYKRLKKQVSYDSGATWQDVSPAEYMKGDLIEADSNLCGYAVYTRWVESGYTCVGYDRHAVEYEQTSNDNINWTYTQRSRTGRLLEANSEDCGYVPPTPPAPTDYSTQYFTIVATSDCVVWAYAHYDAYTLSNWLQYSTDSGSTWSNSGKTFSINVTAGDKVMFKGVNTPPDNDGYGIAYFCCTVNDRKVGTFEVEGNIMSLLYGDNFIGQTELGSDNFIFGNMFKDNSGLTSAENLILPSTALTKNCYYRMFCYCTGLTTPPELPATTLAEYCYQSMFYGCSSLTTAPELPATTLAKYCYVYMFLGCSSLTTAPVLSAATLAERCYTRMFESCTNLSSITCLATDIRATGCTNNWVDGVSTMGAFVKASSMNDWPTGKNGIPSNWIILNNS